MRSKFYQNILDKYPKAYDLYFNTSQGLDYHGDNKHLFNFFDNYKLFISIEYDRGHQYFNGLITDENAIFEEEYWTDVGNFTTRIFCENEAFEKAFELLEKHLNTLLEKTEETIKEVETK